MSTPVDQVFDEDTWQSAGDVAQTVLSDIAIRTKDRADEALDAKRVHGGMTLDEYFAIRGEN